MLNASPFLHFPLLPFIYSFSGNSNLYPFSHTYVMVKLFTPQFAYLFSAIEHNFINCHPELNLRFST